MRFMMIVKNTPERESRGMPSDEMIAKMGRYNEELHKAGVLLDMTGLHPSSKGARVRFEGQKRTVIDGPFTESKELIGGYWLIQVKSREEALEWARRIPFEDGEEVELRQLHEIEDFQPSPAIEREKELMKELAKKR
jgi:hypothetical protein